MKNQGSIWASRLFLATACCMALAVSVACAESTVTPVPRPDDWWTQRNDAVNARVKEGNVDLLMIGDSITHGWESAGKAEWDTYYAKRNAVNMGFSGDRTQHVLWRLENGHLAGISPKLAVIMIGTNNFGDNTAEEIAEGVKAIVAKLRATLPDMKILLLAIFPRTDVDKDNQEKLRQATALFAPAAEDPMVEFLDINRAFLNREGVLTKEVMPDFLHPNELGYALWAHAVEPTIARLMGEEGWSDLFNGKDLTGWSQVGGEKLTWGVDNGMLFTDGGGGGWLGTTREFANFELELEFKVPAGGNSGVFVRSTLEGNPAYQGLEIQVLDDDTKVFGDLKPWQFTGSVYSLVAPSRRASKAAGEWQTMYIRYEGVNIQVKLNGEEIVNSDISAFKDRAKDHPGVLRTAGFIGLQDHGSRLDYRNIKLRELP
jgi:beta-glucosidase